MTKVMLYRVSVCLPPRESFIQIMQKNRKIRQQFKLLPPGCNYYERYAYKGTFNIQLTEWYFTLSNSFIILILHKFLIFAHAIFITETPYLHFFNKKLLCFPLFFNQFLYHLNQVQNVIYISCVQLTRNYCNFLIMILLNVHSINNLYNLIINFQ